MAIKKSELYSSLWSSCDLLRGGMDASQYKDYVLVLLFIKYISDKYADVPYAPITIPKGASFKDMVALKGKPDIGDQINKKIIAPLANGNKLSDMPDFNDANKLGSGPEMVKRLTDLIAIFEDKRLDFSKNRAEGDDILGDAYEYLMRHFATESGKSKGQSGSSPRSASSNKAPCRNSSPARSACQDSAGSGRRRRLVILPNRAGSESTHGGLDSMGSVSSSSILNREQDVLPATLRHQQVRLSNQCFRKMTSCSENSGPTFESIGSQTAKESVRRRYGC